MTTPMLQSDRAQARKSHFRRRGPEHLVLLKWHAATAERLHPRGKSTETPGDCGNRKSAAKCANRMSPTTFKTVPRVMRVLSSKSGNTKSGGESAPERIACWKRFY
jgi:hypothetical protein